MDATEWQEDEDLKHDLEEYVKQNMKRNELLDFVREQYPMYAWSLRTLCRRLNYFKIQYIDLDTDLEAVEEAVRKELSGPGSLLGYRALTSKLREVHNIKIPRDLVYAMMQEVDPTGLEERGGVGQPKRPPRVQKFKSQVTYF